MLLRILASVLLLFSVIFMPLWVSVILAIVGMFYFALFFEATIIFLISDLFYGVKGKIFNEAVFISFILAIITLGIIELLKRKLRFYK